MCYQVFAEKKHEWNWNFLNELNDVYKEECPSRSFVFKWVAEFKRGRENVIDENCGGRPS